MKRYKDYTTYSVDLDGAHGHPDLDKIKHGLDSEIGFWCEEEDQWITNPFVDVSGRLPMEPEHYGFYSVGPGRWEMDPDGEGETFHLFAHESPHGRYWNLERHEINPLDDTQTWVLWSLHIQPRGVGALTVYDEPMGPVPALRSEILTLCEAVTTFFLTSSADGNAETYNEAVDTLQKAARHAKEIAESFYGWE